MLGEPRRAHIVRIRGRICPPLFAYLHCAIFVTFFGAGRAAGGEWRPQEELIFLAVVYISSWGLVPQEQVFARQGFFVVSKTEQTSIPLGVRPHLGGWG